ncbi:hypothetical protein BKK42_07390 [Bacillus cereus]|uniref:hypothetical protein n=1 Tax=Bacillus paranthracis TaxID=2026186 RepID=UPI00097646CF|nr:hypothetical protein BKK43_03905 [Bacillus cereus]ONG85861.1 hypothetical protein BKK42_07390 [Bacillus cereus]
MSQAVRSKRKEMEIGDRVVLINEIKNGVIEIPPLEEGRIIDLRNQVEANVWFYGIGHFRTEPISEALQLDTSFHKNGKLQGIVLELKRESFAIKHQYNEKFERHTVNEDKALTIPFFEKHDDYRFPSNTQKNVGGGKFETIYQYYLNYIIDAVEDGFEEWVNSALKTREIEEHEKESGEYPEEWERCLTDESNDLFFKKQRELELAFAKATGVYYNFQGGLVFE